MTTLDDFIATEILPTLDNPDGYDVKGIAEEVSTFDPSFGYMWDEWYIEQPEDYWKAVFRNIKSRIRGCNVLDETETERLLNVQCLYDDMEDAYDISVLIGTDDDPYTTSDWWGYQPESIEECHEDDFEWIRCADWHLAVNDPISIEIVNEIIRVIEEQ